MSFTPLGRTLLYTLVASFAHPTLQFGSLFRALRKPADSASRCRDSDENCAMWAATGECAANPSFLFASCLQSCTTCDVEGDSARNRTRAEMRQRLEVGDRRQPLISKDRRNDEIGADQEEEHGRNGH